MRRRLPSFSRRRHGDTVVLYCVNGSISNEETSSFVGMFRKLCGVPLHRWPLESDGELLVAHGLGNNQNTRIEPTSRRGIVNVASSTRL